MLTNTLMILILFVICSDGDKARDSPLYRLENTRSRVTAVRDPPEPRMYGPFPIY